MSRGGKPPRPRWRCGVEGCPQSLRFVEIPEGDEYLYDSSDPRSHYWREHYVKTEAEFQRRVAAARTAAREHHRATGQVRPWQEFMDYDTPILG